MMDHPGLSNFNRELGYGYQKDPVLQLPEEPRAAALWGPSGTFTTLTF